MKWELKNSLILIGYMGSGKTSVGQRLAEKDKLPFVDTDHYIEEQQSCSIKTIFEQQGEEAFRAMETDCLHKLLKEERQRVISVGGGLPLREENRSLLKQLGLVIYLKAEPDTIFERIRGDVTRPLLQTDNPRKKIEEMMACRESAYLKAAELVIRVDGKTINEVTEEIEELGRK